MTKLKIKKKAIVDIIKIKDPEAFLAASNYAKKFE